MQGDVCTQSRERSAGQSRGIRDLLRSTSCPHTLVLLGWRISGTKFSHQLTCFCSVHAVREHLIRSNTGRLLLAEQSKNHYKIAKVTPTWQEQEGHLRYI